MHHLIEHVSAVAVCPIKVIKEVYIASGRVLYIGSWLALVQQTGITLVKVFNVNFRYHHYPILLEKYRML